MSSPEEEKGKEKQGDEGEDEREADRELNRAAMSSTGRLGNAIAAEEAKLPAAIVDARQSWAERGGEWDEENDEPAPLAKHTAWSWQSGADWSTEEKAKLSAAKQKLVGGTLGFASCGTGWFVLTSNAIAEDSAATKIGGHTNTTTTVDEHVDHNAAGQAAVGIAQGAYLALGGGITALGVLGYGMREYYNVCAAHAKTAGDPYEEVMAEVLAIDARIRELQKLLEAEQEKAEQKKAASSSESDDDDVSD